MLNCTIKTDVTRIKDSSLEVFRNDKPSNTKYGEVCLYFRAGLPIKSRTNLELLNEMIVFEVIISRKNIYVMNFYHSPN